ncbi:putative Permease of the major facilitator superfamily [Thiomonas arsenitoxydans]|uniref:Permease of the major facilitator superfamily n=1 Tax=Thiomonas arsenitoxydans (strain DSM 22701 / CIP 110005 / 3As) TaxID=426114 RepID=D6CKV5_THIA3|nr:MFS transporter [Thiomonas arsenitoxydans]CAZ87573.1 Putative Permease of the major facilitator superfamily [Thiomonas arsenitoxydans]CQR27053.1 putative Permease of the major facilitator superfamily [Thiomonas arsenitoxydans]CQR30006.1 putative Permease of the major facilitator superfamily [Thiomonas arsenitoxydans]CQR30014.1 putative Permease of the major facilitator superfamily [Thiomonas arsenitoxydans]CQR32533.1 putative Permease of the major facilitator superfamily [Thiomonas arsenito
MQLPSDPTSSRLPRTVWMLGFVSLFMDMSSELIHALLPVYMTTVLGLSVLSVGVVEGIAEATASMLKVVSGVWSDRMGSRKWLAVAGYGLSALTKPLFPLASGAGEVIAARFIDRIGKGIRGAPRDALVADATPPALRNAAYGLRQSLDTVGAVLGPLAAIGLLAVYADNLRLVLWFGVIPAVIAVAILALGVREPRRVQAGVAAAKAGKKGMDWRAARELPPAFWQVVSLAALFTVARLTEAFLVLRGDQIGVSVVWIALVTLVLSLAYALSAYPVGLLAARWGRKRLFGLGLAVLAAAMLLLGGAMPLGMPGFWLGVALWGLHMGLTQGLLSAAVAEAAPPQLRGTAFGLYHLTIGLMQLLAAIGAGWLWQTIGAVALFTLAAALALLCLPALWLWLHEQPTTKEET